MGITATVASSQRINEQDGNGPPTPGFNFGASLAAIGDLNRDGVDDLIVGAPRDGIDGFESGDVSAWADAN